MKSDYSCDCGYSSWTDNYFVNEDGELEQVVDFMNEDEQMIYPRIKDKFYIELDTGNRWDWTETHWCPNCRKEFSFQNGT